MKKIKKIEIVTLSAVMFLWGGIPSEAAVRGLDQNGLPSVKAEEMTMEVGENGLIVVGGNEAWTMPLELRNSEDEFIGEAADAQLVGSAELPSSYRNGKVTAIRNQSSSSLCWAFAATDTCRINGMKNGPMDGNDNYSPYHLSYAAHNQKGDCWINDWIGGGGNNYMASSAMLNWEGPVLESTCRYPDSFPLTRSRMKESDTHLQSALSLTEPVPSDTGSRRYTDEERQLIREKAVDEIKSAIYRYGAVSISFASSDRDSKTNSYYHELITDANGLRKRTASTHAVVLTGWDDDYVTKAENPGAFLLKNSYGENFGDAGYAWISYEDASMTAPFVYVCEDTDSGQHEYAEQFAYDGCGYSIVMSGFDGGYANVFTAKRRENIGAVGFYMPADGEYTVCLERNLRDGIPGTGKVVATASGTTELMGFCTVAFEDPVKISSGETFAVVVNSSSGGVTCQFYEGKSTTIKNVSAERGQSFVCVDGGSYLDTQDVTRWGVLNNACIKAYANPEKTSRIRYCELDPDGTASLYKTSNIQN